MCRKRCQKKGLLNQALSSVKTHGVGSGVQLEGNLNLQLKNKKLWLGILFTFLMLLVYRLGYFIQLPFITNDPF